MKNILKKILKKTHITSLVFYIFRIFKIQNNKIICINFNGKGYGCNPKYIAEALLESK